jgi:hypothetical protein
MSDTSDSQLDALLARLHRDVLPAKDLWPYIEAHAPARRSARPWQFAAGFAALAVSASLGWHLWQRPGAPDASYLRARAGLEPIYRVELGQLPPDARVQVERDLDVIQVARADIRRALASDPGSPLLQELLTTTWQQEFDLYQDVAAGSTISSRRSL